MARTVSLAASWGISRLAHLGEARDRRPDGAVEGTRWLFLVFVEVSLVLALPASLSATRGLMWPDAVASVALLGLSMWAGYVWRAVPWALDVVDGLALLTFAAAYPEPTAVLPVVFAALWFRSLYGSDLRSLIRCTLYGIAIGLSLPSWLPGHALGMEIGSLIGVFATMFLITAMGRLLVRSVQAREQAARLDDVLVRAGSQLVAVTEVSEIIRIGRTAYTGMCDAMPGLRVLEVVRTGAALHVEGVAGCFATAPGTLPGSLLAESDDRAVTDPCAIRNHEALDDAVGSACAWVGLTWPDVPSEPGRARLVIGAPGRVPEEAVRAFTSLANQITMALRGRDTKLPVQSTLDDLTSLANRTSFAAAVSSAVQGAGTEGTTVLFVDLDDFGDVNDVFGHSAGDSVLRKVAALLHGATRPQDLCARLGGDEFAVLLRGTGSEAAEKIAQRIVDCAAAPIQLGGRSAYLGASVGIATAQGVADTDELLHHADAALSAAKAAGKGRTQVFHPGLLLADPAQVAFEQQLSTAATNGELIVRYQPVLSLPELRCTAVEALVRWQHPQQGLLYPVDFIRAAERTGAIRGIDLFVLRQACADLAEWRRDDPSCPLAIHVNISPRQLEDESFVEEVLALLSSYTVPAECLVLEFTRAIADSSPVAIAQPKALASHGVVIAMDGVGTADSALTKLHQLPVQIVKIDKSYVVGSAENAEDLTATQAIVSTAKRMGVRAIAEGVESIDQHRLLQEIGVEEVQGYLYLRPTAAEDFALWLRGNRTGQPAVELANMAAASSGSVWP